MFIFYGISNTPNSTTTAKLSPPPLRGVSSSKLDGTQNLMVTVYTFLIRLHIVHYFQGQDSFTILGET